MTDSEHIPPVRLEDGTLHLSTPSRLCVFVGGYADGRDEKRYYSKDGIKFMEALKYEFCGAMIRATDVEEA